MAKKKLLDEEFQEEKFSDKWGVYHRLTEVESKSIQEDITGDFILAKLNENQKESIIELVRDAYFCKKEIEKLKNGYHYEIDKNGKYKRNPDYSFKKIPLTNDEQEYIKNLAKITFNSYMIKVTMVVLMYRNIENNVLVELLAEKEKLNNEMDELKKENEDLLAKMKKNIKKGNDEK